MPREMTSSIVLRRSKKRRMPLAGTARGRSGTNGVDGSMVAGKGGPPPPAGRVPREKGRLPGGLVLQDVKCSRPAGLPARMRRGRRRGGGDGEGGKRGDDEHQGKRGRCGA